MPAEVAAMLEGRGLRRSYPGRGGLLVGHGRPTAALDGVDLVLREGEILGLVGRSGAGKSTLVRVLAGLEACDGGEVVFAGTPLRTLDATGRRAFRRAVQVVFQDPAGSLDPRLRVARAIAEPLRIHGLAADTGVSAEVERLLASVGLPTDDEFARRLPHELSGGERQRVAIARALAVRPRVLLLDEPVAALDASVRGQVMNVLLELRDRLRLTILLVAHDLRLVEACSERVAVMLQGRIVEQGTTISVLQTPQHPYTLLLAEASSGGACEGRALEAESRGAPPGCRYRAACPRAAERCASEPRLQPVAALTGHLAACWFPTSRETRESKVS